MVDAIVDADSNDADADIGGDDDDVDDDDGDADAGDDGCDDLWWTLVDDCRRCCMLLSCVCMCVCVSFFRNGNAHFSVQSLRFWASITKYTYDDGVGELMSQLLRVRSPSGEMTTTSPPPPPQFSLRPARNFTTPFSWFYARSDAAAASFPYTLRTLNDILGYIFIHTYVHGRKAPAANLCRNSTQTQRHENAPTRRPTQQTPAFGTQTPTRTHTHTKKLAYSLWARCHGAAPERAAMPMSECVCVCVLLCRKGASAVT